MSELSRQACIPCRKNSSPLSSLDIASLLRELDQWQLGETQGAQHLQKSYAFPNFRQALDFSNAIGALAEQEDHHPSLLTEWGKVTVRWWTHSIGGLHLNDFILAARCDDVFQQRKN